MMAPARQSAVPIAPEVHLDERHGDGGELLRIAAGAPP